MSDLTRSLLLPSIVLLIVVVAFTFAWNHRVIGARMVGVSGDSRAIRHGPDLQRMRDPETCRPVWSEHKADAAHDWRNGSPSPDPPTFRIPEIRWIVSRWEIVVVGHETRLETSRAAQRFASSSAR
jgi:hypothetical protein